MKNAPQPNLAHVERGQRVLVWLRHDKKLVEARVQSGVRHGEFRVRWSTTSMRSFPPYNRDEALGTRYIACGPVRQVGYTNRRTYSVKRRDEGVTWCRTTDDEAADAFRALWGLA